MSKERRRSSKFLITILVLFVIVGVIAFFKSGKNSVTLPDRSVLILEIKGELPEIATEEGFPPFTPENPVTHQSLLRCLQKAYHDERIERVVLKISSPGGLFAKLNELREAILALRANGKTVWAYLEGGEDTDYFLAGACDKIFIQPYSILKLDGLASERLYYKSMLEKIGIEFEAARRGKFKSAVEPFIRDGISSEDKLQRLAYLSLFDSLLFHSIAKDRQLNAETVTYLRSTKAWFQSEELVSSGLVDSVIYFNDLKAKLLSDFGAKNEASVFITRKRYEKASLSSLPAPSGKVAVVYILGTIVDGKGSSGDTGDEPIVKALTEIKKNDGITGVLLRVDSPGGSAIASDKILSALSRLDSTKPVVVSMSDVAASGGYWVSLNARKIVASPYTITGSIGVLALKPNLDKLQSMIALKRDVISTAPFSDGLNLFTRFSPEAYQKFDALIGMMYQEFISKVAASRGLSLSEVDALGQGRVWSGLAAKGVGLIDEVGGFRVAMTTLKREMGLDSTDIVELVDYPKPTSIFESFFSDDDDKISARFSSPFSHSSLESTLLQGILGPAYSAELAHAFSRARLALLMSADAKPLLLLPYVERIR